MDYQPKPPKRPKRFGLIRPKRDKHYNYTFYCLARNKQMEGAVRAIPLKDYAQKHFLSESQVLRLVKKGLLRAVSFKKKFFVEDIQIDYEDC